MIKKKEYMFLSINYIVFFAFIGLGRSGIIYIFALSANYILPAIALSYIGLFTLFLLGGEGIIYCVFTVKSNSKSAFIVLLISICFDILIYYFNKSELCMFLIFNQLLGVGIGRVIKIIINY